MPTPVSGVLPFDCSADEALQVRLQELVFDSSERRLNGPRLREHVDRGPILFHHLGHAADLPFQAFQPIEQSGLGVCFHGVLPAEWGCKPELVLA